MSDEKKVFISYAREDIETARKLYYDLKKAGVILWMDEMDLLPGHIWKTEIKKAIEKASFFILLISENSVSKEKGFVHKEYKVALEQFDERPSSKLFFIPVRIDSIRPEDERLSERLKEFHWADLFTDYKKGIQNILLVVGAPAEVKKPEQKVHIYKHFQLRPIYKLRSEPRELSDDDVREMIKKHDFYCKKYEWSEKWYNESGSFKNAFIDNGDGTITDDVTGLMWQKTGSNNHIYQSYTQVYIDNLNNKKIAGYNDWRLPTLEELASLLKSLPALPKIKEGLPYILEIKNKGLPSIFGNERINNLYIDSSFDKKQWYCWTSDKTSDGAWCVNFNDGVVDWNKEGINGYVRAVRS